jgi:hypothetical protein
MPEGTDLWFRDVIGQREYGPAENVREAAIRWLQYPPNARELREAVREKDARGYTFYIRPEPYRVGPTRAEIARSRYGWAGRRP